MVAATTSPMRSWWLSVCSVFLALSASNLRAGTDAESASRVIISVHDQKLVLVENGGKVATYPVSTSKFGLGDAWGSMATPLGSLQVAEKIGDHAVIGAVFHARRYTGEVLPPNAPGRDPIVTRIIWLRGLEAANANAFNRCIYIHGTPEERLIGKPASYGCIRMCSKDVAALYSQLPIGATVQIIQEPLPKLPIGKMLPPLPIDNPPGLGPVIADKPATNPNAQPRKSAASGMLVAARGVPSA